METNDIDDALDYRVELAAVVMRGPFKMLPRDEHIWKGEVLRQIVEERGWGVIENAHPL